jgi:hypothetical protein
MYLRDLAASLLRRWYLVTVAVVLTVSASLGVLAHVGPTYQMSASVVLVPPTSTEDPGANRYLALSGLTQAVSVVIRALNGDQTNAAVDKVEPHGTYLAAPDYTTSAPIIVLTATASSPTVARALLDASLSQVPTNLARLQDQLSIGQNAQITAIGVSHDDKPTVVQKKRLRLVAALAVLLMGLFAVAIGAIDGAMVRRREESDGADPVESGEPPTDVSNDEVLEPQLDAGRRVPRRRARKRAEAAATSGSAKRRHPGSAPRRAASQGPSEDGIGPRVLDARSDSRHADDNSEVTMKDTFSR